MKRRNIQKQSGGTVMGPPPPKQGKLSQHFPTSKAGPSHRLLTLEAARELSAMKRGGPFPHGGFTAQTPAAEGKHSHLRSANRAAKLLAGSPWRLNSECKPTMANPPGKEQSTTSKASTTPAD